MERKALLAALLLSVAALPAQAACREEIAAVERHIQRTAVEGKPEKPVDVVVRQPQTGATRVVDLTEEPKPNTQAVADDRPGDAKVAPPDAPSTSPPQESWFTGQNVRELLDDARDMAAAGNEAGCRDNVLRVKRILELAPPTATEPRKQ